MPGQFLTKAEREQLSSFPPHPTEDDLIIFFGLTAADNRLINKRTGDYNRLGCALQLGTLRYLGFVPDDLQTAPSAIVDYLAKQLQVNPSCLVHYGKREKTRTNQLQQIQSHLGWRKATQKQQEELNSQIDQLHQTLQDDDKVRLDAEGKLIISPLQAEDLPLSAQKLQQLIGKSLPQIDLSDLLIEMDKLSGFSYALTHAGGNITPPEDTRKYLYAAILAQATGMIYCE